MQMMAGGAIGGGITSAIARAKDKNSRSAQIIAFNGLLIGVFIRFSTVILGFFLEVFGSLSDSKEVIDGAIKYAEIGFGGAISTWFSLFCPRLLEGLIPMRPQKRLL